jgi:hypothetical protein
MPYFVWYSADIMWLNNRYRARPVEPITSPKIRHLAGIGLENPSQLTTEQIRELAASVMAHIEPRRTAGGKPSHSTVAVFGK